jgi:phosphohistidine phosphatase
MILYICRHAAATDPTGSLRDEDRPLTPEGIAKFRKAAKGFCALDPEATHILTSPLLRARQTAEILFDVLAKAGHIAADPIITDSLAPPGKLDGLLAKVRSVKNAGNIVAVGHEPTLSTWIGQLCFGQRGGCELKKGAIAAIELTERGRGDLVWLMQPGQLRQLA